MLTFCAVNTVNTVNTQLTPC